MIFKCAFVMGLPLPPLRPYHVTVHCCTVFSMTTVHTYTHTSLTQCSSESRASIHVQEPHLKPQQIIHTVKLINKARKKEYKIEKLGSIPFSSLESIKAALKDRGGNVSDGIGYIEPGHGLNGKQKMAACMQCIRKAVN